ncbi:acyl-CoA dehydrogenase family protein [Paractinoplanes hotanensis]|uniref:Acyl-CoA dehydrogenase n=1 Tax=Paractinoplanes hotanensis TaxID=2906497 RepID=A0ABT0XWX4_9ACTN|nr:acyl-CoA dehydrogenase family protein [Actinoplanes hotanensis]MCM4078110.1 acyl-CoA dehydrogenase [Actinoplanes hotanensis]
MKDILADSVGILVANATKTEQQGHPTAESLQAARRTGAFALGDPVTAAGATEIAGALTGLGRGCASTAWIAGTCFTSKFMAAGVAHLDETAASRIFADPDALFCGSGRPGGTGTRGPEGVRLTGRWPIVSGCEDAEWAGLAVVVDGTPSYVMIPMTDLGIEHTWDTAGMRGTGSHTVVAEDVLVPADQVGTFSGPPGPAAMLMFSLAVLAPVVGATLGALDVIDAMFASDRKPFMTEYARMADSPGARHWLADATARTGRAERSMLAVAAEADARAEMSATDLSRLRLNLFESARDCRAALELMLDLHGASGFSVGNPLQRLWRDVAVGSRHPLLNGYLATENYGYALTGGRRIA